MQAAVTFKITSKCKVIRRNGQVTDFDGSKIQVAMTKAFLDVEGSNASGSARIHDSVGKLAEQVVDALLRRTPEGGMVHIEDIQDQVELALMRAGEHKVARSYVLYRAERARLRAEKDAKNKKKGKKAENVIHVKMASGDLKPLDEDRLRKIVAEAMDGLEGVSAEQVMTATMRNLYDGISEKEVATALVISTRVMIDREPNYSQAAARMLMDSLRREALSFLEGQHTEATQHEMIALYPEVLKKTIKIGVEVERLADDLGRYDLVRLGAAIKPERDLQFTYLGLQTLYDRYFLHHDGVRFELPQVFFMRVAMGLAINEVEREDRAIEFYNLLSSFDFMSSTPTLFNSGTLRPQLSSCYLTTIGDNLEGIYDAIKDNALLSKYAGGLGNDWSRVRGMGAHIKGTNGKSQGVVPFLKVANDTAVAVNQGGKRRGAVCAYLETWHIDIEDFLELRKNTGDERRRTHDMNSANWIPDLFMKRVAAEADWTLFSPDEAPDLHDLTGKAFEARYKEYEAKTECGEIKLFRKLPALQLWRKMLGMIFETGHPWITFKDPCNIRYSNKHTGVVHSSNLCTEIMLHTTDDEIAVCFPAGTQVLTRDGQMPIEDCDGREVFVPFDGKLQRQSRFLQARLLVQGEKLVYELVTKSGIVIEATEEHPFLVQMPVDHDKPKTYQWKKLKELQAGDFIACPTTEPVYAELGQQDTDFTAAGWMLGDGWMSSSYGVCFGPHEQEAQQFVLPIINKWHQASELGNNTPHGYVPRPYTQPNGVVNWHSQREGFIRYVEQRFGFVRAKGGAKYIGSPIKVAEPNQIASFLSGLFSADGCVMTDERKVKGGVTVSLSSASIDLLRDVQLLLKPFGIHGRIRGCEVGGREGRWQGQYEIKGAESILNFAKFIGFSLTPIKHVKLVDSLQRLSTKAAFQHSAVVSIVSKGIKPVFDLALAEDHNFLANGLVVHNCNLGSVNLTAHVTDGKLDVTKLERTVTTAMRMLDNVIDYNYYSVPQARKSNLRHRPVGMGIMGFQDALYKMNLAYATTEAVEFADQSMEAVSYFAIRASSNLAAERGKYPSYNGSLWSKGILPIDSLELLGEERGEYFVVDHTQTLDWDTLRNQVKTQGMRNSNVMAIAPTATISNICGVSQSIEPTYQNLFVKSNLSGEFTVINPYLVQDLKALDMWDEVMINDLKYFDGSLQPLDRVPDALKAKYATAFEIDARWLVEAASRRQKWIDQGQSLNLYMKEPNGTKLDNLYKLAWVRGLKTTYYLRTLGATGAEKTSSDDSSAADSVAGIKRAANLVSVGSEAPKACSLLDPDCEACQ
ncbi:ribonucleoside-diphosphate reductase subunit alpha [Thiothrix litoralis]|uniref:Ribonucleoside-diphosphate reductase n=1 Tax=Thiothrix litoralis TaxID=2891210 RepID=A0ABX7WQ16_9GAMM|nr:ribonucleoside-diphosphate reductase subunit alpha [Thiothrix litoralis]QTR45291.1 ribonucleoside-diphosphate reductase subunit alpha [Thiothrix litoralis]